LTVRLPGQAYLQIKGRFSCGITSKKVLPALVCPFFLFIRSFHGKMRITAGLSLFEER
jgi:hypothetical protein